MVKKLDPQKLKKGDLFRGKCWRHGMNHIFKEIDSGDQKLVVSMCNYFFYPDHIHEPSFTTDATIPGEDIDLCYFCKSWRKKDV